MGTSTRIRRRLAGPCIVMLLAACGGSNSGDTGTDASDEESPLAAIFGGNESTAEMRAKDLAREQAIADCMNELGWDYTPVDYQAQYGNQDADTDAGLSPKEYGAKYAYGFVRNYELYELPYLLGEDQPQTDQGQEFVDPNGEYYTSLSQAEQQQYDRDLYGEQAFTEAVAFGDEATVDEAVEDTVYTPIPIEEQGCQGQAQLEVYGESPFDDPDTQTRLNELFEDMGNDAGVKAAQRDWAACMADENPDWELETSDGTYARLERRKAELAGQELIETDFDPETGEPLDDSIDMSDSYSSNYGVDGSGYVIIGQPEPLDEDQLELLRTEERELWDADQKCQKSSKLADAQREAEQKLADTMLQEFPGLDKSSANGAG